jgi:hypothetical protein
MFVCRAFPGGSLFMKAQGYLDLHWGMKPIGLMMRPPLTRHMGEEFFLLEALRDHEEIKSKPLAPKRWSLEA